MASATTTPVDSHHRASSHSHSRSRSGAIPSRPTTPLRPPSRTSLRASQTTPTAGAALGGNDFPLTTLEPAFGELSDAMADLEANMMHLQLLNESISRFNENFGAFLYGMNMTAFCVDFPEAPIPQSFTRHTSSSNHLENSPFPQRRNAPPDNEATFMTTDTSFVMNPPTSSKPSSKYSSVPPSTTNSRGGAASARGPAARGRAGGSGIARGTSTRGARGAAAGRGSGIARGVGRGRGVR
ncbi:hypothetical protein M409DRAFT_19514 [Zasmidium cellare ATCC 36951]|uniref:DASH complex subunit DAM1 n=1 Tax=Zasmidium cellare ATCC 36951 TaxID=1080233 RepID=A0A6A6CWZ0_ZASCE|nr:uncharacterized protein M409DRAFT_19514 [Zasmidium cellare ATCC 36951]KAF2170700.1 hypothetical protein M409DRAFT_19514 [Zasmidium cellare ATCC 36951]